MNESVLNKFIYGVSCLCQISTMVESRIRYVSPLGIISTIAGSGSDGFSGDDGLASLSSLSLPFLGSSDDQGGWWISDSNNNVVRAPTQSIVPWSHRCPCDSSVPCSS